jgi:hypothetical protein
VLCLAFARPNLPSEAKERCWPSISIWWGRSWVSERLNNNKLSAQPLIQGELTLPGGKDFLLFAQNHAPSMSKHLHRDEAKTRNADVHQPACFGITIALVTAEFM